ncbi:MAG: DNA mismatch repair endonuclease MutL [Eubacterium sp.]|nr:DNA mismatch repair endonuclease MutL [Eubacterium sp.]MDD6567406.1 DNA mismatch repair endonuclease MutL [Eubacteriales bacterium]MDY4110059.1 DNA mismatch repair endonuclease MutL [Eubacterium sp.]
MARINVLPKEIYQLIAAGEVVERPSSVVKEMIENSLDAGAKNITLEIKNGGSTYIRITDDGCGIERDDVRKVFISHATSKISKKDDLNSIGTLGFRGEAMASISAVAKVELLTKAENEEIGTRYEIAGGEELEFDDAGCPNGTTIVVRDIFFNTPARMKFLKKDVTEGNQVAGIVDRMAISHPEISFRFIRDGKQMLITSGNGDLKSTIYSVLGKEMSDSLMSVDYSYENMRLTGFVSKPTASRKSRAGQFFYINNRIVKSKTAMAALEQAYKNTIMVGRFPACVLNIELDPSQVDVNVHPAKTEVRFANEKPIFNLVYYGVKTAIENDRTVKEVEFKEKPIYQKSNVYQNDDNKSFQAKFDFFKKKDEPPSQQVIKTKPREDFWRVEAPKPEYKITRDDKPKADINIEYKEPENFVPDQKEEIPKAQADEKVVITDEKDNENVIPDFKLIGEAFKTYLIVEIENELYFIDKHAAHERMNFERFKSQATVETQMLLAPVVVNLTKDEFIAISENIDLIKQCGFELEEFGESQIIVRAIPSLVDGDSVKDLMLEIAQKLLEHKTDILPDKIDWIYHSASCRGAVKAGDYTSRQEQEMFVKKLLAMPNIRFCPHGRPVFIKMSKYDIEKQFGRVT